MRGRGLSTGAVGARTALPTAVEIDALLTA